MYIFKNSYLNITRRKGKNILIGLIITAITIGTSVALVIQKSGDALIKTYKEKNPLEVSFSLDTMGFRSASTEDKSTFTAMSVEDIISYGTSDYVKDYYYLEEATLSSSSLTPVLYEEDTEETETREGGPEKDKEMKREMGDFRITGYSDPSYISEFISGTKKIKDGEMFSKESTEKVLVISEELAEENDLHIGDEIQFYLPSNEDTTFSFKIVGIYEDNSDVESGNFMSMNAMNSRNQLYTNITTITEVIGNTDTSSNNIRGKNGLTAKFYLQNNGDLNRFKEEVKSKGLSDYYQITTNEEEALAALKPIQNIRSFSFVFLIIIMIVGALILAIINLINIRERKYEIGVLRAIGMRKSKVALQFVIEIFLVACVSLLVGTAVGSVLSQPVTNQMLKNEISSYQTEENRIEENFGGGNFGRPSMGPGEGRGNPSVNMTNQKVDYVDTLTVKMDGIIFMQVFLVSLILTLTTSVISILFINRYEPNKILQNR